MRRWSRRPIVLLALAAACATPACGRHHKVGKVPAPTVPDAVDVSGDEAAFLKATSDGVQEYECKPADKGAFAWVLTGSDPAATELYDETGQKVGRKLPNGTFEASDGSKAIGEVKGTVNSPTGKGIPWLLYKTKGVGVGTFGKVTSVQRVDTVGGLPAPPESCNAQNVKATHRVAYTAAYYFFSTSP